MIISPLHSSSCQNLTPETQSIKAPPVRPSPKRKRPSSKDITAPLQLDTSLVLPLEPPSDSDSPRTKVANSLCHLDLCHTPLAPSSETNATRRKRLKPTQPLKYNDDGVCSDAYDGIFLSQQSSGTFAADSRDESPVAIGEIPGYLPSRELRISLPVTSMKQELQEGVAVCNAVATDDTERLMTVASSTSNSADGVPHRPPSPTAAHEDIPINQAALTWQDDEITGHDIDFTSVDDDGEGINGIGFKPTPAIAYARSQKRKQQVNEWRAREAREARQRRFERRRAVAGLESSKKTPISRRMVRFEEIA